MYNTTLHLCFSFLFAGLFLSTLHAQVGIGTTTPNANAILELDDPGRGFLPPRFDRSAISYTTAEEGMMVYDDALSQLFIWDGTAWQPLATGGSTPWDIVGGGINYTGGEVGIGTTAPAYDLDMVGANEVIRLLTNGNAGYSRFRFERSRGSTTAPNAIQANDALGELLFLGYNGTQYREAARIRTQADVNFGVNDNPGNLIFETATGNNVPVARMAIRHDGNVGIGVANPLFQLQVANAIGASDVFAEAMHTRAEGTASFNDFVTYTNGTDAFSFLVMVQANGTQAAPTATATNDTLGAFAFGGFDGTNFEPSSSILSTAASNYSGTDLGSRMSFFTTPVGTTSQELALHLSEQGNVGIGGIFNPASTLEVDGDLRLANGTNVNTIVDAAIAGGFTPANLSDDQLLTSLAIGNMISDSVIASGDNLGNHQITTPLTTTLNFGPIINIGNQAQLVDANVNNTVTIVGLNDPNIGILKLGSDVTLPMVRGDGNGMAFMTSNIDRMVIDDASGNIGIAETAPAAALDIDGDLLLENGTNVNTITPLGAPYPLTDDDLMTGAAIEDYVGTVAGGGLTNFVESNVSLAGSEAAVWSPDASLGINAGIVLSPTGTGYIATNIPDGTAAGGNARGSLAVDLQFSRLSSTQVASGNFSAIGGGNGNTASGSFASVGGGNENSAGTSATVAGGNSNAASGDESSITGGANNTASGNQTIIAGGTDNTASGNASAILGGNSNQAQGNNTAIAGGANNTASFSASFVGAGVNNNATGLYTVVTGGLNNTATGGFATVGGGTENNATGSRSVIPGGVGLAAASYAETVVGSFNTTYTPASALSFNAADRVFVVGNGQTAATRSDAVVVLKSGAVGIGTSTPVSRLQIAGDIRLDGGTNVNNILPDGNGTYPMLTDNQLMTAAAIEDYVGTVAGGGLTNFVESTAGAVDPGAVWQPDASIGTDVGIVLEPLGTGYLAADQPDGSATGGIARGDFAVDLQMVRTNANQVAAGPSNVIVGGRSNRTSSLRSVVVGGNSNSATGEEAAIVGGESNLASGDNTFVGGGTDNEARGRETTIAGGLNNSTDANANWSVIAGGSGNSTFGQYSSIVGGRGLTARSWGETVVGTHNDITSYTGTTGSFVANDRVFVVGNGASNAATSNAMVVLKSGNVGIGESFPDATLDLAGDFQYQDGNELAGRVLTSDADGNASWQDAAGGTLAFFNEVNHTNIAGPASAWRPDVIAGPEAGIVLQPRGTGFIGADLPDGAPTGGDTRGENAIDWQFNRLTSAEVASGDLSVLGGGERNEASGEGSVVAGGRGNVADSDYAIVSGGESNEAAGDYASVGGGENNLASGPYSTIAGGQANTANALLSSIGGGNNNTASGNYSSIPGGWQLQALSWAENVVGAFNDNAGYTPNSTSAYDAQDRVFVVGNGANGASRSNAIVVRKSGNVGIGESFPDATLDLIGDFQYQDGNELAGRVLTSDADGNASWQDAAGGGLTFFVESNVPLAGSEAAVWSPEASVGGDAGIVLAPLGDGYIAVTVPDNGASGGNARGVNAIDFQSQRNDATQVASGDYSFIGGGQENTADGVNSAIGGGFGNTAEGNNATVGGGLSNEALEIGATVGGGRLNLANVDYSTIGGGENNLADGFHSTVGGGQNNEANGEHSSVGGGEGNITDGVHARIGGGSDNSATGNNATIPGGEGLSALSWSETVLGAYNDNTSYTANSVTDWDAADRLFVVGNGEDGSNRSNAMVILKSGNTGLGTATPATLLEVAGEVKLGSTGLVAGATNTGALRWNGTEVQYSDGTAWQALGGGGGNLQDAYNTGNTIIGSNAVSIDTENGLVVSGFHGSGVIPASGAGTRMMWYPGNSAFRAGRVTGTEWDAANVGDYSAAFGLQNVASGSESFAAGSGNIASGQQSIALGGDNTASSRYAVALVHEAEASGFGAFAAGGFNEAKGDYSTAVGGFTTTESAYEFAAGVYNTTYIANSVSGFDAADRIFVIGNGTGPGNRSDAMTVLKSGNVGIGTSTPVVPFEVQAQNANLKATSHTLSPVAGATLFLKKSRGTIGFDVAVQNNDVLANLTALGVNSSDVETQAGQIQFQVDGAPSATTVPGRIAFRPTSLSTGVPETRMIIKQDGNVGVGTLTPNALFAVAAGTSNRAQINLASSSPPTTPTQGDLYSEGSTVFFYDGATWLDLAGGGGSSLWTDNSPDVTYTAGNVGIGTNNPNFPLSVRGGATDARAINVTQTFTGTGAKEALHITTTNGGTSSKTGIYNDVAESAAQADRVTGILNTIDAVSTQEKRGIENRFDGGGTGNVIGVYNDFGAASGGDRWGIYNLQEDFNYFSGNVGIGSGEATTPAYPLFMEMDAGVRHGVLRSRDGDLSQNHELVLQRARGNTAVTTGYNLGTIGFGGYNGSLWSFGRDGGAFISAAAIEDWNPGSAGAELTFATTPQGDDNPIERLFIKEDGNVGVGVDTPSERLHVSGNTYLNGGQRVQIRNLAGGGAYFLDSEPIPDYIVAFDGPGFSSFELPPSEDGRVVIIKHLEAGHQTNIAALGGSNIEQPGGPAPTFLFGGFAQGEMLTLVYNRSLNLWMQISNDSY